MHPLHTLISLFSDIPQYGRIMAASPTAFRELAWFADWRRSLQPDANPMRDEQPWMTFNAIAFLRGWLQPGMRVFEWGSGGSTIFFAQRVAEVVAVENDASWAEAVREACAKRQLAHAAVVHLPPEPVTERAGDPSDPNADVSSGVPGSFHRYAAHIENFPDAYFDLVSVDGRARPGCLRRALAKVKPGGFLLLDNAERDHYAPARRLPAAPEWEFHDFSGAGPYNRYGWQTVAWQRRPS